MGYPFKPNQFELRIEERSQHIFAMSRQARSTQPMATLLWQSAKEDQRFVSFNELEPSNLHWWIYQSHTLI